MRLGGLSQAELLNRLNGDGLRLRTGPLVFSIQSSLPQVHAGLRALYAEHLLASADDFVDFHVSVDPARGLRRWFRPQLYFRIDGSNPFTPLPGHQGLPMLEWGMNWCVTGLCHQYLVLHAAVLERDGRALVMPAPSGSGKSTLCAALIFNGWRLLSDELALIDLRSGQLVPMPRPVSLKNASIEVMLGFAADRLRFGSVVADTTKGRVAHFAPPADAVRRESVHAAPGCILLPRYSAGAATTLTSLSRGWTMMRLIENAFNYNVQGEAGFEVLGDLVSRSRCAEIRYSDLADAVERVGQWAGGADQSPMPP